MGRWTMCRLSETLRETQRDSRTCELSSAIVATPLHCTPSSSPLHSTTAHTTQSQSLHSIAPQRRRCLPPLLPLLPPPRPLLLLHPSLRCLHGPRSHGLSHRVSAPRHRSDRSFRPPPPHPLPRLLLLLLLLPLLHLPLRSLRRLLHSLLPSLRCRLRLRRRRRLRRCPHRLLPRFLPSLPLRLLPRLPLLRLLHLLRRLRCPLATSPCRCTIHRPHSSFRQPPLLPSPPSPPSPLSSTPLSLTSSPSPPLPSSTPSLPGFPPSSLPLPCHRRRRAAVRSSAGPPRFHLPPSVPLLPLVSSLHHPNAGGPLHRRLDWRCCQRRRPVTRRPSSFHRIVTWRSPSTLVVPATRPDRSAPPLLPATRPTPAAAPFHRPLVQRRFLQFHHDRFHQQLRVNASTTSRCTALRCRFCSTKFLSFHAVRTLHRRRRCCPP